MLYVLVCGSRTWRDRATIEAVLRGHVEVRGAGEVRVLTGGSGGADRIGDEIAVGLGCRTKVMRADWGRHGKRAGFLRNEAMLLVLQERRAEGHEVLVEAFTHGSPGTAHTIDGAHRLAIDVRVHSAHP